MELKFDEDRIARIDDLLREIRRDAVPIREAFLQLRGSPPSAGPLSALVRGRHEHALDLYLLLRATAPMDPQNQVLVLPERWSVLVGRSSTTRDSRRVLRRSLATLEKLQLVRRVNAAGPPVVEILDERGNGELYVHPFERQERYIKLHHSYWMYGLDQILDLPAKATLLIALSLAPSRFTLPLVNAPQWYGISADTLRRGMKQLVEFGIVRRDVTPVSSPKAPLGKTLRRIYTINQTQYGFDPGGLPHLVDF